MKTIISARLSAKEGEPLRQFPLVFADSQNNSVRTKILNLLKSNPGAEFDFLVVDKDNNKSIKYAGDLVGREKVCIVDDKCIAKFKKSVENGEPIVVIEYQLTEGALPREETVKQLKELRKKTKGIDIGDKISDMSKQGANISYIRNPVDSGIESLEDYWEKNKKFVPNVNLKRFKEIK